MIPFLDHNYYNKMLELQEKLRKSEKNRILLEKRFCWMEQESRWRHEACMNKMQMRYIEFLEEQRVRDERNYKLLGILDRVDESLAFMTVKTDRLCILKKEYEASLMRICMNRHQVSSMTGDSGVHSQNENQQLKQDIRNLSNFTPRSRYNVERRFHNSPVSPDRSSQPNYGPTNQVSLSSRGFGNQSRADKYSKNNSNSELIKLTPNYFLTKSLTNKLRSQYSEDLDSIAKAPNYTSVLGTLLNFKNERVDSVIENELEKHIHKIRNLHDNNNPYSLEEIEQNTSGDVLNVTLSDDNLDHLPVEENSKGGEIPTEFKVILATANDLISRSVNDIHVKNDTNHVVSGQSMEKIFSDVNIGQEISSEIITSDQIASINSAVNNSNMDPSTSTPIQNLIDKNQISNDAAMYTTKINPIVESIETITKSPCIVDSSTPNFFHLPIDEFKIENERETFANANDSSEIMNSSESHGQQQGVEYNNDNNIKIVTNTELQNSMNVVLITESQVIPVNKTVNSIDETSLCQTDTLYIDTVGKTCGEKNRDNNTLENDGICDAIDIQPLIQSNANDKIHNNTNETIHDGSEENYERSQVKQYEVSDNQDLQLYPQALNEVYEYNDEQYQHDPNQQYEYDSVEQYEQRANGECQYDQKDSQYIGDSNDQFQHQQYIGTESQQYAINLNEQYHEYSVDQNQQYGSNTYVQNPNVVYDSSEMYAYPIQQQSYMPDNAYDESQAFASDQQHQDYQEQFLHYENSSNINNETMNYHIKNLSNNMVDNDIKEHHENKLSEKEEIIPESDHSIRIEKDVIKSILDSDTESNVEKNISNTDSDFNFN